MWRVWQGLAVGYLLRGFPQGPQATRAEAGQEALLHVAMVPRHPAELLQQLSEHSQIQPRALNITHLTKTQEAGRLRQEE